MRLNQTLIALGGAIVLGSCAQSPAVRETVLPDGVLYARHLRISLAASHAANSGGCTRIDPAAIEPSDYTRLYYSPGVVHSQRNAAADAFIMGGYGLCRAPRDVVEESRTRSVPVADYYPMPDRHSGLLFVAGGESANAASAFWTAANAAGSFGAPPWQIAFSCAAPIIEATTPDGTRRDTIGDVVCRVITERPDATAKGTGARQLRGRLP